MPMESSLARHRPSGCGSETSPVVVPMIQVTPRDIRLFYLSHLDKDSNNEPFVSPNDHPHRIAPDRESGL